MASGFSASRHLSECNLALGFWRSIVRLAKSGREEDAMFGLGSVKAATREIAVTEAGKLGFPVVVLNDAGSFTANDARDVRDGISRNKLLRNEVGCVHVCIYRHNARVRLLLWIRRLMKRLREFKK